jgi:SNF2 family DNA or RNA helicase
VEQGRAHTAYRAGQRLRHPQFGVGLIVDVRQGTGSSVIEVVFGTELKRLSAKARWPLVEEAVAGAETAVGLDLLPESPEGPDGSEAVETQEVRLEVSPASEALVARWLAGEREPMALFDAGVQAARFAAWASPDRLISLDSLRGVDQFPHQLRAALRALRDMGGRALLADEVGLGKTIEAGIILKEFLLRGQVRTALVLAPASLVEQWAEELREKFELDFVVSRGASGAWGSHPLVIASLETARHERHRGRVRRAGYDLVIVDEAHRLRNHLTLGWKFVNELGARYLLLLTATPVQNDLRELYNLVTLLRPGTIGTFAQFKHRFLAGGARLKPRNVDQLRELLGQVLIRSQRAQTKIEFPKRIVRTHAVELSPDEASLYRDVSDFVRRTIRRGDRATRQRWYFTLVVLQKEMGSSLAAAVGTLRRLASREESFFDTRQLGEFADRADAVHAHHKVREVVRLLEGIGEKVIVYTQFRGTQELLARAFEEAGLSVVLFHGELGWKEKERAIDAFRGEVPILLSTEAGGEGRNLQFARHLVNFDLPWNPMRVEQRIGRVHRLGQKRDVYVYNLVARGTIESYVLEILEKKIQLFELVVGEIEEILGQWSPEISFEEEIFRIWSESDDEATRERRYSDFATQLLQARKRFDQEQELARVLLPSEDKE